MSNTTKQHNARELAEIRGLQERCQWITGVRLGYDPRTTTEGQAAIADMMTEVILAGWGAWLAERKKDAPETLGENLDAANAPHDFGEND